MYGFGGNTEPTWYPFLGSIDDVAFWNRGLNEQEIQNLFQENNIIPQCSLTGSLKDSLIAYYPFCGNANDAGAKGLNGTVNGATLTMDRFGNTNSAYSFTTNQDIVIPNTQDLNLYPLTISLWYSLDTVTFNGNLFSKYTPASWNGYLIYVLDHTDTKKENIIYPWFIRNTSNRVLGMYGEPEFHQSSIEMKKWYHFVLIVDDSGGKIYVNGQLVNNHPWTGTPGASSNSYLWKIGGLMDNWFHGTIDDVGIWKRALTEKEIQQLYNGFSCNTPPPTGDTLQSFCAGAKVGDLKTTGTNINWYSTSTGGIPLSGSTPLINGTYYATQTLGGCESQNRLAVNVSLNVIEAPTGSNTQTFSIGATISGLQATGTDIKWYLTSSGGSPLASSTVLANGTTYYASQSIGGCESRNRLAVKVTLTDSTLKMISFADQTAKVGSIIEIIIKTSELTSNDGIISYQFNFNYDSNKLQYFDKSIDGTIAQGGSVLVNNSAKDLLRISYMNQNKIIGTGAILKLSFKILSVGTITPTITDFLYNSVNITSILNGIIITVLRYGDIDDNGFVQAYDAALALQYSVGFDPLPSVDPLPWETWRFTVGDVDGNKSITAYDAALILQYSAGIITVFPVEGSKHASISDADIKISIINNELCFSSTGGLIGFNLSCTACSDKLGQPAILYKDFLSAINIDKDIYRIGLATTTPPVDNQLFMKIPILKKESVTFDLLINNIPKNITVNLATTGIGEPEYYKILIYPNPARTNINISFSNNKVQYEYTVKIINMVGQEVFHSKVYQPIYHIDVSNWTWKGIYLVQVTDKIGNNVEMKKVIIQ